jgi:hypothetical protein
MTWGVGDTIVLQEVWRDRLWAARPMRVVEDTDERLVLWCPKGTVRKVPATPPTRERSPLRSERVGELMARCDWDHVDSEWDVSTLWFVWPGEWHAVWVSWFEPGVHWGWYGNLQEPYVRTTRGIRTMDLMLDVLVEADGRWRWKDEDDLQAMIDRDLIDDATVDVVRRAGLEVVRKSEAGEEPFCDPWPSWTPDPSWPTPVLPEDWATWD